MKKLKIAVLAMLVTVLGCLAFALSACDNKGGNGDAIGGGGVLSLLG